MSFDRAEQAKRAFDGMCGAGDGESVIIADGTVEVSHEILSFLDKGLGDVN